MAVAQQGHRGVVAVKGDVDGHLVAAQPGGHGPGQALMVFCY